MNLNWLNTLLSWIDQCASSLTNSNDELRKKRLRKSQIADIRNSLNNVGESYSSHVNSPLGKVSVEFLNALGNIPSVGLLAEETNSDIQSDVSGDNELSSARQNLDSEINKLDDEIRQLEENIRRKEEEKRSYENQARSEQRNIARSAQNNYKNANNRYLRAKQAFEQDSSSIQLEREYNNAKRDRDNAKREADKYRHWL